MENFDVVIVGAGPSGGQCARELAGKNLKVLLAERNADFSVNSYSSAGAPQEILSFFSLPNHLVGSSWNKIKIQSSNESREWQGEAPRGVVMDFMKLRSFLADEAKNQGAEVRLGYLFKDYQKQNDDIIATFKNQSSKTLEQIRTKILVDATGGERQVLAKKQNFRPNEFLSTGIEYLVEVPENIYEKWSSSLSLFMGQAWMPQGYSWIFPMEPYHLKVGVGRYFQNDSFVPYQKSYSFYLDLLMEKCLGSLKFPVLDRHGKTIHYTHGRKDLHFDGNVIAIGDAVSTINPLAFEGIRHAMGAARIAAKHIKDKLQGDKSAFKSYQKELTHRFWFSWKICEKLMNMIYKDPKDKNIDLMVRAWGALSFEEMNEVAFHYKLSPVVKFLWKYWSSRLIG